VFFTRGNTLYCETGGKEKKIIDAPWACEYIYALSAAGPYIAVSNVNDSILFIKGSDVIMFGKPSLLLKTAIDGKESVDFRDCITESPDNKKFAVLQLEGDFVTLSITTADSNAPRVITLNDRVNGEWQYTGIYSKWISNNELLLYTPRQGWIVDLEGDIRIYDWVEKVGSTIYGIIP